MKDILKNIKGGIIFSLTALLIFTISGVIYASLTSVEPGNTLTADKWNELIGTMNTFSGALDGGLASPTGAVIAFNRHSCPSGWKPANGTNGTPDLRGKFIRGLNSFENGENKLTGTGSDEDGVDRDLGSIQEDAIRNIKGTFGSQAAGLFTSGPFDIETKRYTIHAATSIAYNVGFDFDASRVVPTGADNRPKNVALIYCVKE